VSTGVDRRAQLDEAGHLGDRHGLVPGRHAPPAHPRVHPTAQRQVERYHRTLADELCYAHAWNSEDERHDALHRWLIHFNDHRSHTATGDLPPATRLHAGVSNVMIGHI
jgi:hypothetical protein